ncbi:unnamed protein product [Pocillopora meandrina]|uniref:Death domain-containing protein n=1 Tax=Pocillopora meandrina TaxID=46732 RepID=A0AAU9VY70_9CNID|nr:unnamed protein product [Pocillopora meandrina]
MEEEHRNILRKHREALVRDLEPLKLLNRLDVLGDDDRELVKAKKTRSEQAEELLDMLPRKGEDAFQNFITALCNGSQKFLAKPLIRASGMDESRFLKDEVGMTEEHKRVLRASSDQFSSMDIKKLLPYLTKVLDEYDKQELQSDQKSNCTKMDQLLTEILPKKGPEAFGYFVKAVENVDLPLAKKIQESGREGSPNDDKSSTHTGSIQETSVYSLKSEVQDILDEQPEVFEKFCKEMDKEIFGNGWKRLFKELGLPAKGESFVEKEPGSHTLNVIKGWISYDGSGATVQTLLDAVNRSQRKDCVRYILKPLNLGQDYVDSPVNDMTKKFESLSPREVKCFGDLTLDEATRITNELGQLAINLLRRELEKVPGQNKTYLPEMMLESKNYTIRRYTNLITDGERPSVIKKFRQVLPAHKGVIGPLLSPDTFVREIRYSHRRDLTRNLCANDNWKALAEKLGLDNTTIQYLDNRRIENPADEVLRNWEVKAHSTVGKLYDILVELDYPIIADYL